MTPQGPNQHTADWLLTRHNAHTVHCPTCRRPIGEPCRNLATGQPLNDQPAHYKRIQRANN